MSHPKAFASVFCTRRNRVVGVGFGYKLSLAAAHNPYVKFPKIRGSSWGVHYVQYYNIVGSIFGYLGTLFADPLRPLPHPGQGSGFNFMFVGLG